MTLLSLEVICFVFALIIAALFSYLETSFTALRLFKLKELSSSVSKYKVLFDSWEKNPQRILITILIANNFAHVSASVLIAEIMQHFIGNIGLAIGAAIATVLAMSPKIITFDEPDGSLDPRNRSNLIRLLSALPQTLIIASCNMNFAAAIADRAVVIDNGRITADGDAKSIMNDTKLMARHGLEVAQLID